MGEEVVGKNLTQSDVLFIAGLFPKELEFEIQENSIRHLQNAANNLQWEILLGLNENLDSEVKIINSLFIGSFPKLYQKCIIKTTTFNIKGDQEGINVGFINLPLYKHISRYIHMKKYIQNWANIHVSSKYVIGYSFSWTMIKCLLFAKFQNTNIKTCLIVPDLPEYMNLENYYWPIQLIRNRITKFIYKKILSIDCLVLLTKQMNEKIKFSKNYIVMEGISPDPSKYKISEIKYLNCKIILYSGGLLAEYGIISLIEAFKKTLNQNYKLVICGSGLLEAEIKKLILNDNRIVFLGLIPREDVIQLQMNAYLLVNPRPKGSFTKYSFPSKLLEYMVSGTPVLSYKLEGIPKEYFEYMYCIEDYNTLLDALNSILSIDFNAHTQKGLEAKRFVMNEKNRTCQAKRILSLLEIL